VPFRPSLPGFEYAITLDEPAGVLEHFPLPEVEAAGFALASLDDVTEAGEPVRLAIQAAGIEASGRRDARVSISVREREVASAPVRLAAGAAEVTLTPPEWAAGVLRATVHDATGRPRAERLIFRRPSRGLAVEVVAQRARAALREPVRVVVKVTDEARPAQAWILASVVDDEALAAAPARFVAPRLPAQVLLAGEVRELADPDAYLGEDGSAARRLDLLLGTQGWRRFAFHAPEEFLAEHGAAAARVLGQPPAASSSSDDEAASPRALPVEPADDFADGILSVAQIERGPAIDEDLGEGDAPPYAPVRELVHAAAPELEELVDFAETIYWQAGALTDEEGRATFVFELADAPARYRVRVDVVDAEGALGAGSAVVVARPPIALGLALPAEVTQGDHLDVPVIVESSAQQALPVEATAYGEGAIGILPGPRACIVAGGGDARVPIAITALASGPGEVRIVADAAGRRVAETSAIVRVAPAGYPVEAAIGGKLDGRAAIAPAGLPGEVVAARLAIHASPVAVLAGAAEHIAGGTAPFAEAAIALAQVSALALRGAIAAPDASVSTVRRVAELLELARARLAQAERESGGFGWLLHETIDPGLTASAALALADAAPLAPALRPIADRARAWLAISPPLEEPIGCALAAWALGEGPALARVRSRILELDDVHALAIGTSALLAVADAVAAPALDRLARAQEKNGAVGTRVETTALAVLAWTGSPAHAANAGAGAEHLAGLWKDGGFGAPLATALAARAIAGWLALGGSPAGAGAVVVRAGDAEIARVATRGTRPISLELDRPGALALERRGAPILYTLSVRGASAVPPTTSAPVGVAARLMAHELAVGEDVELRVTLSNRRGSPLRAATAVVGLPAGLSSRGDAIGADASASVGRTVTIVARELAPHEERMIRLPLVAAIAGRYTGAPTHAHASHAPRERTWAAPISVTIR
jgi:hypothetical protein